MSTAFQLLLKTHGFHAIATDEKSMALPWQQGKNPSDSFGIGGLIFHKAGWASTPKSLQKYVALNFDIVTEHTWIAKLGNDLFVLVWYEDEGALVAGTETGIDGNRQIAHLRIWPTEDSDTSKMSPKAEEAIALDLKDWVREAKRRNAALGQK
jgi:hypothetical protein